MDQQKQINDQMERYKADFQELVDIKAKQFDMQRIAAMIAAVPQRKWNAAQGVVDATVAKKVAEQNLKKLRAQKQLQAKHDSSLKAAPDRQAWVDNQLDVQAAEAAAIYADGMLIAARLAYECLDDMFTAGKKILDRLADQDRSTAQYDRYRKEGSYGA